MNDSINNLYDLEELKLIKAKISANFAELANIQPIADMDLRSLFTELNSVLHGKKSNE
jgi:hypothetical protein